MNILLTNDDGFLSPGLQAMKDVLCSHSANHNVWVVAPDGERSGMSHFITIRDPIRVRKVRQNEYQTSGSPADCVRISLVGLMDCRPDIIISGINLGPNLGTDIIYSGTTAAARQAAHMSIPALSVSIFDNGHPFNFIVLAKIISNNLSQFIDLWDKDHFININGPNHKTGPVGIIVTHPCRRYYNETPHQFDLPNGDQYWFLDGRVQEHRQDLGSDLDTVLNGSVSLSPIYLHPVNTQADYRYRQVKFME